MAIVFTEETNGSIKSIKAEWTSDGSGDASGETEHEYSGKCLLFTTDPVDGPTDNYDVTVLDDNGLDVLAGAGADRDTTNTEQKVETNLGAVAGGKLTFVVANAGAAKSGVAYLYLR